MPTVRPRHAITETPEIERALRAAGRRWPADRDRPGRLLRHLIEAGAAAIDSDEADRQADRLAVIAEVSGALTGVYGPGYLDELREDWPE